MPAPVPARPSRRESPGATAQRVVEPGERVLWAGRPDQEALTREARRRRSPVFVLLRLLGVLAVLGGLLAGWSVLEGGGPLDPLIGLRELLRTQAPASYLALGAIPAFAALILGLHARSAAAFVDRASRLTYALTDQRVLILLDDTIEAQFTPDQTRAMRLRERTERHQDLIFQVVPRRTERRGEGLAARERRHVGFKALPDARAMKARIETWRGDRLERDEAALEAFLDRADGSATPDLTGARRVSGGRYDLTVEVPADWIVEVRTRRRPFGTTFLDLERWRAPDGAADWNVLRARGPFGTTVTVHADAVSEPVSRYESAAAEAGIVRMLAGEIVRSRVDLTRGRFGGWSVTRRRQAAEPSEAPDGLDQPGFLRTTTLHDGVIQLAFVSSWPAGAARLERAVDRIEESTSVRSEGVTPARTGSGVATTAGRVAVGTVGTLLGTARVLFGLMLLVVGAWAGWDQAGRGAAWDGALAELEGAVRAGVPTIPADRLAPEHEGTWIHVQGNLAVPELRDPLTGVRARTWRLDRRVRSTDGDGSGPTPPDDAWAAETLELGSWRLSTHGYGPRTQEPLPERTLASAPLQNGWQRGDGGLRSEAHPDALVTYTYAPMPEGIWSALGVARNDTLDPGALGAGPVLVPGATAPVAMVERLEGARPRVQTAVYVWTWLGLVLLLRPLARPFPVFRGFTEAPLPRRIATTLGIATGSVLLGSLLLA